MYDYRVGYANLPVHPSCVAINQQQYFAQMYTKLSGNAGPNLEFLNSIRNVSQVSLESPCKKISPSVALGKSTEVWHR
jgi:hypothetical protein